MAKIRSASNFETGVLDQNWRLAEAAPNQIAAPTDSGWSKLSWLDAHCPGTVASALRAQKLWDFEAKANFDASDYWYCTRFDSLPCGPDEQLVLELDGLATLCDVWLNGEHVLRSENMFCEHRLNISTLVRASNELVLKFSSLAHALSKRRPRPRFKTRLVEHQQLRWFRTSLLGRIPAWCPPVAAVGPWRGVRLTRSKHLSFSGIELRSSMENGRAIARVKLDALPLGTRILSGRFQVGSLATPVTLSELGEGIRLSADLEVPHAERWWPHSHGEQPRYPAQLSLGTERGPIEISFDSLAFRSVALDTSAGRFALIVNDTEIYCRGACWTPSDVVSLADSHATVATVRQARAAGMNMLRVGGTMVYESDAFYEECERSGIMIWQDFMFANCDYPGDDATFCANVDVEAEQFLSRTETRACLTVLCGNSEIEQQASMLGLSREHWSQPLFDERLRGAAARWRADVPYVTSTPSGGALPFQVDVGSSHYYGVGAYQRPLEDARRAGVKFTPECLAFANIPEEATIEHLLAGRAPFHDPRWKARVPRDGGAGWDFDDVRDYYTELLFGVDLRALRYEDPDRALALGRVASGEVMARTLGEWRRKASDCRGALIWFLRDLWPGAGWGLIDSLGLPKAAYYFVRRAMQPLLVHLSDEGLNGLRVHIVNDKAERVTGELDIVLLRADSVEIARGSAHVEVPPRTAIELDSGTLFERFIDVTHAYRFGPAQYDVAIATLRGPDARVLGDSVHFPHRLPATRSSEIGLTATAARLGELEWNLTLKSQHFAFAVGIDAPGLSAEDSYFHIPPGGVRNVLLRATTAVAKLSGTAHPLNAQRPTRIVDETTPKPATA